ncbi:hypothetical protein [Humisphaera borealis]|uniref:Uncharacterized protein n=1 Tax=Humisphaera borealis TaxID=2807512 RepID=A0A7M2WVX0_9BACT|nr:hypothetical protein [Humisphaera borealis]QOV88640.1 hypothetical protein IPV69_20725 [Humisphaera borealis]
MASKHLPIPIRLQELLQGGTWAVEGEQCGWGLRIAVSADRVRQIASDESEIYFCSPPFKTVAQYEVEHGLRRDGLAEGYNFWKEQGAVDQLVAEQATVIGDFGPGTDSPIILDYRDALGSPKVRRLKWSERGDKNEWVVCAKSFDEFADLLGLGRKD